MTAPRRYLWRDHNGESKEIRSPNDTGRTGVRVSEGVRVSRKTLSRLYGAARQHVECEGELYTADVKALKEAESALGRDGPYLGHYDE